MTDPTATTSSDAARGLNDTAAAEVYASFFVPALFDQFPEPVLDHAGVAAGARVLDVGCGTGIVAAAARRRVGPGGVVAAIDPNEGMLAVARRSEAMIDWRAGEAESLPFGDDGFDHTVSQFAAMFFRDAKAAVAEMARVTRRGGTVTIATWCGLDRTPGYRAMVALIADEFGQAPADALRAPFSLGAVDDVRSQLTPIGPRSRVDRIPGTARFPSIAAWVRTEVRGWTLADLIDESAEAALLARAERELTAFVAADGSVAFPAPALVGTVIVDG